MKFGENHESNTCSKTLIEPCCVYCKGTHLTTEFNKCPEFQRQKQIKKIMSETNASYRDAVKNVTSVTYAKVVDSNS